MRKAKFILESIFGLGLLCGAVTALAATQTGNLSISAVVPPYCSVQGSALSFGNYQASQLEQAGTIGVNCSNGTSYTVSLDSGTGAGANTASRKMVGSSSASLNYELFQDAARTKLWGNSVGTDTVTKTGQGVQQNLDIYGRIPAGQYPGAGTYNDVVGIMLTY